MRHDNSFKQKSFVVCGLRFCGFYSKINYRFFFTTKKRGFHVKGMKKTLNNSVCCVLFSRTKWRKWIYLRLDNFYSVRSLKNRKNGYFCRFEKIPQDLFYEVNNSNVSFRNSNLPCSRQLSHNMSKKICLEFPCVLP